MKKPEWIYSRIGITPEDIWRSLPHKRNEYFSDMVFKPEMQLYYITSMRKKYGKRKESKKHRRRR